MPPQLTYPVAATFVCNCSAYARTAAPETVSLRWASETMIDVPSPPSTATPARPRITIVSSSSTRVSPAFEIPIRRRPPGHVFTWLKMPYIAETSATATKPTSSPITMMTAGSNSEVSFLIL